ADYEAAVASILEQMVPGAEASRGWRALVRDLGEPAPGPRPGLMIPRTPSAWLQRPTTPSTGTGYPDEGQTRSAAPQPTRHGWKRRWTSRLTLRGSRSTPCHGCATGQPPSSRSIRLATPTPVP